jgi:hypothetical protein
MDDMFERPDRLPDDSAEHSENGMTAQEEGSDAMATPVADMAVEGLQASKLKVSHDLNLCFSGTPEHFGNTKSKPNTRFR